MTAYSCLRQWQPQPPPQQPPPPPVGAGAPIGAAAPRETATAEKTLEVSEWPAGQDTDEAGASSWMPRRTSKEASQTRQR
ncbi:hypothetical protein BCD48_29865 [Pseudofrankia sp. BMG5.36]|nr:hypothetical protein BCD48_29865 [Pseudofrankia sp. BMG5.36]